MPRPLPAEPTGLRGPGQTIFPEEAKEQARRVGLKEEAALIYTLEQVEDAGGDWSDKWVPQGARVRGRIDPVGSSRGTTDSFAAGIRESTTHIISLDPDVVVTDKDHIEIEGRTWTITADEIVTEASTKMVQVAGA